jgi:hypothetical protein
VAAIVVAEWPDSLTYEHMAAVLAGRGFKNHEGFSVDE